MTLQTILFDLDGTLLDSAPGLMTSTNTALARCPETLRDYVALHELVHFVHPDHGPGFYGLMDRLMPDWRQRRKELRRYGGALVG